MTPLIQVGEDLHCSRWDPRAEVLKERLGLCVYIQVSLPFVPLYLRTVLKPRLHTEGAVEGRWTEEDLINKEGPLPEGVPQPNKSSLPPDSF